MYILVWFLAIEGASSVQVLPQNQSLYGSVLCYTDGKFLRDSEMYEKFVNGRFSYIYEFGSAVGFEDEPGICNYYAVFR